MAAAAVDAAVEESAGTGAGEAVDVILDRHGWVEVTPEVVGEPVEQEVPLGGVQERGLVEREGSDIEVAPVQLPSDQRMIGEADVGVAEVDQVQLADEGRRGGLGRAESEDQRDERCGKQPAVHGPELISAASGARSRVDVQLGSSSRFGRERRRECRHPENALGIRGQNENCLRPESGARSVLMGSSLFLFELHRGHEPSKVQRSTFNAQRSTFNAQRSTINAQRSTFNAQRSTFNAQRSTFNPADQWLAQ
jgi:hypothetical protein